MNSIKRKLEATQREGNVEEDDQMIELGTIEDNMESAIQKYGTRHLFYNEIRKEEEELPAAGDGTIIHEKIPNPFNKTGGSQDEHSSKFDLERGKSYVNNQSSDSEFQEKSKMRS